MKMCMIENSKKSIVKNVKLISLEPWKQEKNCHDTIQCLKNVVHYLNMNIPYILVEIIDLNFLVH